MFKQQTKMRSALPFSVVPLLLAMPFGVAQAASNSADPVPDAQPAVITLHVPAGALVQFDGVRTQQVGITRRFVTPPLAPGRHYSYDVSVSWTDGPQTVDRQRRVSVKAGEQMTFTFGPPALLKDTGGVFEDPAAPNPWGTAYYQNPLNWPVYPRRPGSQTASPAGLPAQAGIRIRVPADAEVFFDGEPTTQKGTERLFITPPLPAKKKFHYDVRARWKKDGKTVEQTRKVEVSGGTTIRVDF